MEIALLLLLLPGLIAFGVSKALRGAKAQPINEIIIDLVLQTVLVFTVYYLLSLWSLLGLPKVSDLAYASLKVKTETDLESIGHLITLFERALLVAVIIAFVAGISSAIIFKEYKLIQRLGRPWWLFQSDADESAWKTTFSSGSLDCWVHIDTKGGQRYVGLSHCISWEHKDGGIGLSEVHLYDEQELVRVADYIYIQSEELNGPILFIRGNLKPEEKNEF
ncbi:MAG: hypothetical protein K2X47_12240 [Bdellovibrionales bacterium]|nr:hypothetical protein [Bdellovibrionales bacterium]